MDLNNKIQLNDINDVLTKYSFQDEGSFYYFSRKNNIGTLVYDHFFRSIFYILKKEKNLEGNKGFEHFIQAIEYCNTDYNYEINDVKANLNFSERKFNITNMYNVFLYEIYVTKIFKFTLHLIHKHQLSNYLILNKYFGFFSNIDYEIDSNYQIFDLKYKHYDENWLKFESSKIDLLNDNKYYLETDIKGFYDNINHEILIGKLKYFFSKYGVNNHDNFLYIFGNILYKVNGYDKTGLPQGIMASDILSNLFLWLVFFIDKDYTGFKINGDHGEVFGTKYINYNDDFILFSKDDTLEITFNSKIKFLFSENFLPLSLEKTTGLVLSKNFKNYDEIDFQKIIDKDSKELTILKNIIINYLKQDIYNIDVKGLKRYFKWSHNLKYAKKNVKNSLALHIFTILFKDLHKKKGKEKIQKVLLLLVISPSNFVHVLGIMESFFQKKYNKSFEGLFLHEILQKYYYLVTDSILVKLYIDLDNPYQNLKFHKTKMFLLSLIKENNNKVFRSFLNSKTQPLDLVLKDNGLVGLHDLIYGNRDINSFKENIIGIKFFTLFSINIDYENINGFLDKNRTNLVPKLKLKLNNIMDDMLIIKNISPNFYLKHPSFIADLYSVLNILFTLLFHVIDKKNVDVKLNGGNQEGYITIKLLNKNNKEIDKGKEPIRKYIKDFDLNHIHLLYYISKKRAIYNHKETDIDQDINFFIYKKNDDLNTFNSGISTLLTYILFLIDRELKSK